MTAKVGTGRWCWRRRGQAQRIGQGSAHNESPRFDTCDPIEERWANWLAWDPARLIESHADAIAGLIFYSVPVGGTSFPLIVGWLILAALIFTLNFRFIQLRGFSHAIQVVRGRYSDPSMPGEVTPFQALTAAVSGTVGLGNIAGVAVAVAIGGAGATFWMIVAGLLGMASKFTEVTLGVKYRDIKQPEGMVAGGRGDYLALSTGRPQDVWGFFVERGVTIILTTHYLEEAEMLCRNIGIIDKGILVECTSMKALLSKLNMETFILDLRRDTETVPVLDGMACRLTDPHTLEVDVAKEHNLNDVFSQLSAANIEVLSMRNKSNRLEELFVELVKKTQGASA